MNRNSPRHYLCYLFKNSFISLGEKAGTFILANIFWVRLSIRLITLPAATAGLFATMSPWTGLRVAITGTKGGIEVGISANESMRTGQLVHIDDLFTLPERDTQSAGVEK